MRYTHLKQEMQIHLREFKSDGFKRWGEPPHRREVHMCDYRTYSGTYVSVTAVSNKIHSSFVHALTGNGDFTIP